MFGWQVHIQNSWQSCKIWVYYSSAFLVMCQTHHLVVQHTDTVLLNNDFNK